MNHTNTTINNELRTLLKGFPTVSQLEQWLGVRNMRLLMENTSVDENWRPDTFFEPVVTNTNIVLGGRFL